MAIPQTLELTDGTTTLDLLRGIVRLEQDGWAPQIAPPRTSELAGGGVWDDVDEELQLGAVYGPGDNVGAAHGALASLIEQARRWALGDPSATVVRLRAAAAGTRLSAVLEAAVLGGELPALAASFHRLLDGGALPAVDATLRRRGAWLDPAYETAASSASASQVVKTITWPSSHPTWSPMSLALTFSGAAGAVGNLRGFVLVGATAAAFTLLNAETFTGTDLSSVANTPALNGAYLRYLPATNIATTSSWQTLTNPARAVDVYAVAEAVGQDFTIRAVLSKQVATTVPIRATLNGQDVTVPAGARNVFYLGRFDGGPLLLNELRLRVATATTHGSNQLRVDTIIAQADEGPATKAIYVPYGTGSGSGGVTGLVAPLGVRNEPLAYPAPIVGMPDHATPFGDQAPMYYTATAAQGLDPILPPDGYLQTRGPTAAVLPLLIEASTSPPSWRPQYSGAAANIVATGRRYKAYLSLE